MIFCPPLLLKKNSHENVVKLVNVHNNFADMSLCHAFDYAEYDLNEIIRHTPQRQSQPFVKPVHS
ncbi:hypothetical protein Bca52824_009744 [Brassica carinata]|uniref:Uncharacterized protein n=1 Tax=Brassica carinata TaxID=52824 RepID=A0A8X7WBG2_BRACI|nr:hypothetical protein Bca52824_009744 [Brassica carinata]